MAVICVKSRAVLWSTAHDKPLHSSVPWGKLATLNHTTIAYITQCQLRPMLCVRDALTSEIKATKPILRAFSRFHRPKGFQSNSTPAETLCISLSLERFPPPPDNYRECVGRLSVAGLPSGGEERCHDSPPRLCFSENRPQCGPSVREKLFLCLHDYEAFDVLVYCFEYEISTDEDISISEARILQNGDQRSAENLIFKVLRIQIYEQNAWGGRVGPPELNPTLKQSAQTEISPVNGKGCTFVGFHSFTEPHPLTEYIYDISLEQGKPYDGSIPAEFYPRSGWYLLVTKPKRAPAHIRRHSERVDFFKKTFAAQITLTERYMLFTHEGDVYFFAYEPRW